VEGEDYSGVTKYILYFALQAALHAFKFAPGEFSLPSAPSFHSGVARCAFKIAPGDFVEPLSVRFLPLAALHHLISVLQASCLELLLVEGGGFEPPKVEPADLQSAPFGRSGTPPENQAAYFA
jgi:hypothetical protein